MFLVFLPEGLHWVLISKINDSKIVSTSHIDKHCITDHFHKKEFRIRLPVQLVGQRYGIMGQLSLSDVISIQKGVENQSWGRAFGKIKTKHLDFVACGPNDLSIQIVVELYDSGHKKRSR